MTEPHPTHCMCIECAMPSGLTTADALQRARDEAQRIEYPDHCPISTSRRDNV